MKNEGKLHFYAGINANNNYLTEEKQKQKFVDIIKIADDVNKVKYCAKQ